DVDLKQAASWYKAAATLEYPVAEFRLANLLLSGKVMREGYPAPFELMLNAARAGFAEAQYQLGLMYLEGQEVPANRVSAACWLILATARLDGVEQQQAKIQRDQVEAKIGPVQYARAESLADQIFAQSA